MHLLTILAFAVVFWQAEQPGLGSLLGVNDLWQTAVLVAAQPVVFGLAAMVAARRALRRLHQPNGDTQHAQRVYHRTVGFLRGAALAAFAVSVVATPWPKWFRYADVSPALQILGDLIVFSPFAATMIMIWLGGFAYDRELRDRMSDWSGGSDDVNVPAQSLRSYLTFHIRHQLLVAAVPMALILFAADLTRGYEEALRRRTGVVWGPDAVLGVGAALVFVLSPILLRRIWPTAPLKDGPVRRRLEAICTRIGLRCRDILVWHSDGMVINAAVMGIFARVRYVLLSDALLTTMSDQQVESVFGHEAGHVRHRHIPLFLVFAFVGWLVAAGLMELMARAVLEGDIVPRMSLQMVQALSVGATVLMWAIGFGWLSRRFEREADLFAARCITPPPEACRQACSVHLDDGREIRDGARVCSSAADVFTSALDRVAVLNGIPHEERSWRHSSIGSRIRFLTALAGDPNLAATFVRRLRRIKTGLVTVAILGSAGFVYYWTAVSQPAVFRLSSSAG